MRQFPWQRRSTGDSVYFPNLQGAVNTPEGAACDLARAFIKRDAKLFEATCVKPIVQAKSRDEYSAFLKATAAEMKREAERREPSPGGPKTITKVFAARSLSRTGPASFGWAVFGFQDVKFVDVGAILHSGKTHLNRTLVVKDAAGDKCARGECIHCVNPVSPDEVRQQVAQGYYDLGAREFFIVMYTWAPMANLHAARDAIEELE